MCRLRARAARGRHGRGGWPMAEASAKASEGVSRRARFFLFSDRVVPNVSSGGVSSVHFRPSSIGASHAPMDPPRVGRRRRRSRPWAPSTQCRRHGNRKGGERGEWDAVGGAGAVRTITDGAIRSRAESRAGLSAARTALRDSPSVEAAAGGLEIFPKNFARPQGAAAQVCAGRGSSAANGVARDAARASCLYRARAGSQLASAVNCNTLNFRHENPVMYYN